MNKYFNCLYYTTFILLILSCDNYEIEPAQTKLFVKYYNENNLSQGTDILKSDNGYFILGTHNTDDNSGLDLLVFETDEYGNIISEKVSFGNKGDDIAYKMINSADGNYIICGYTQTTSQGVNNAFVKKIDNTGNEVWMYTYDSDYNSEFHDIILVDNYYYTVGYMENGDETSSAIYAKISLSSDLEWLKKNNESRSNKAVSLDYNPSDESFRVLGEILNPNQTNLYYFRFNQTGSLSKVTPLQITGINEHANKIISNGDEDIILSSKTVSNYEIPTISVLSLKSKLQVIWNKTYNLGQTASITDFQVIDNQFILLTNTLSNGVGQIKVLSGRIEADTFEEPSTFGTQAHLEGKRILIGTDGYLLLGSNIQLSDASSILLIKTDNSLNF